MRELRENRVTSRGVIPEEDFQRPRKERLKEESEQAA